MNAGVGLGLASVILVLGFAGSRALGVIRNMVLAGSFGAGPELDAYFAAFRIPDLIFQVLAGAALGAAFLPTFAGLMGRGQPDAAWRLAGAAISYATAGGAAAAGGAFVLAPALVPLMVPWFPPEQQQRTVELTRIMLGSSVFFCASGLVTGVLHGRRHFLLPAIAPWGYNLSIIAGALLLDENLGVAGPAWGVTTGALVHLAVQLPGLWRVGMPWRLRLFSPDAQVEGLRQVLRLMGPRVLGLATLQAGWLVTTSLASGLHPGSLAALTYAWTIAMLPVGMVAMAPAMAAFPVLAEAAAAGDWLRFRTLLNTGIRLVAFLGLPTAAGLAVLGETVVTGLLQRGEFTVGATQQTAQVLVGIALGLPAHGLLEVLARGSYALQDTRTPLGFALLGLAVQTATSLILMGPLGAAGIAIGLSLGAWAEAGGLGVSVLRRTPGLGVGSLVAPLGATLAATAAATLAMGLWVAVVGGQDRAGWLLTGGGGALAGLGVYGAAALALRHPDLRTLGDGFRRLR